MNQCNHTFEYWQGSCSSSVKPHGETHRMPEVLGEEDDTRACCSAEGTGGQQGHLLRNRKLAHGGAVAHSHAFRRVDPDRVPRDEQDMAGHQHRPTCKATMDLKCTGERRLGDQIESALFLYKLNPHDEARLVMGWLPMLIVQPTRFSPVWPHLSFGMLLCLLAGLTAVLLKVVVRLPC